MWPATQTAMAAKPSIIIFGKPPWLTFGAHGSTWEHNMARTKPCCQAFVAEAMHQLFPDLRILLVDVQVALRLRERLEKWITEKRFQGSQDR